jgi:hypothetical protein
LQFFEDGLPNFCGAMIQRKLNFCQSQHGPNTSSAIVRVEKIITAQRSASIEQLTAWVDLDAITTENSATFL